MPDGARQAPAVADVVQIDDENRQRGKTMRTLLGHEFKRLKKALCCDPHKVDNAIRGDAMGGLGLPEIIIIAVVAIFIFGPKKLPELGAGLGKSIRDFKAAMSGQDSPGDEDKKESEKKEPEKKDANK